MKKKHDSVLKRYKLKPEGTVEKYRSLIEKDIENFLLNNDEMEIVSCFVCNSIDNRLLYKKLGFRIVECQECGMVFVNPRPSTEKLQRYYARSLASAYFQENIIEPTQNYRMEKIVGPRLSYLTQKVKDTGNWLDIGCSSGMLLGEGKQVGWDVYGIEFENKAKQTAKEKGIYVYDKPIENLALKDKFDLVTMFEVLEHVNNPKITLEACLKAMKVGGTIVLTVPNIDGFEFQVVGVHHSNICPPSHLNYFGPVTLIRILEKIGFKISEVDTPGLLDVDNIRVFFSKNKSLSTGSKMLDEIINSDTDDAEANRSILQTLVSNSKNSGHLRVVAKKSNN